MARTTPKNQWNVIEVTSGYGANSRSPFVEIHTDKIKDGEKLQLQPNEARDLAMNLLQASEAAEQDAFLFEFTEKQLTGDITSAAAMVGMFREWRKDHGMNK